MGIVTAVYGMAVGASFFSRLRLTLKGYLFSKDIVSLRSAGDFLVAVDKKATRSVNQ